MDPTAPLLPTGAPSLGPTAQPGPPSPPTNLREAAEGFEAILLGYLLRGLRQTIPHADPKAAPFTRRVYEDLFDHYLGTHLAKSGGLGLADLIERTLSGTPAASSALKARGPRPTGQ